MSDKVRSSHGAVWSLATLLMLSQCVCQNNRPTETTTVGPVDPKPASRPDSGEGHAADTNAATPNKAPVKLPTALDTKDLDDDERAVLGEVLSDQYDPCGKSRSFLESLGDAATCGLAKKLGDFAVTKVAQGLSKRQIVQELLKEQARWASKAEFDLAGLPTHGDPKATRVVVEFSDFQCPHCRQASKPVKELVEKHGAVLYVKQLPLDHHLFAKDLALAALAAHRQGKYWEVATALFDAQDVLNAISEPAPGEALNRAAKVREIVAKVGIDMAKFDKDLADPAVAEALAKDLADGDRLKIGGTPTFFVDGFQTEYEQLETVLSSPPQQ